MADDDVKDENVALLLQKRLGDKGFFDGLVLIKKEWTKKPCIDWEFGCIFKIILWCLR